MKNYLLGCATVALLLMVVGAAPVRPRGGPYQIQIDRVPGTVFCWVVDQSSGDLFLIRSPGVNTGDKFKVRRLGNINQGLK